MPTWMTKSIDAIAAGLLAVVGVSMVLLALALAGLAVGVPLGIVAACVRIGWGQ